MDCTEETSDISLLVREKEVYSRREDQSDPFFHCLVKNTTKYRRLGAVYCSVLEAEQLLSGLNRGNWLAWAA
jgi:hypothetical protein